MALVGLPEFVVLTHLVVLGLEDENKVVLFLVGKNMENI